MNAENLRKPTSAEARENGKRGGLASVQSRKSKKAMREAWEAIRNIPIKAGELTDLEEIQSIVQLCGANITIEQAAVLAVAKKAMKGDVDAFKALVKLTDNSARTEEIAAKKAALEVEKLRIEVKAYQRAVDTVEVGVMIIDNIQ